MALGASRYDCLRRCGHLRRGRLWRHAARAALPAQRRWRVVSYPGHARAALASASAVASASASAVASASASAVASASASASASAVASAAAAGSVALLLERRRLRRRRLTARSTLDTRRWRDAQAHPSMPCGEHRTHEIVRRL